MFANIYTRTFYPPSLFLSPCFFFLSTRELFARPELLSARLPNGKRHGTEILISVQSFGKRMTGRGGKFFGRVLKRRYGQINSEMGVVALYLSLVMVQLVIWIWLSRCVVVICEV